MTPVRHFGPFEDELKLTADDTFLGVGSDAFPDHPMTVGITAWQQQVPPPPYTGGNSWRIPLKPKLAAEPISAKTALLRGAIAPAVNVGGVLDGEGRHPCLAGRG